MENIIVENSNYSLLICLLILKNWKKSIFILDKGAYNDKLKKIVYKCYYYKDLSIKKNFIFYYFEKVKLMYFLIRSKVLFNKNYKIYGDNIMLKYFFLKRSMYLIEDGTWNYQVPLKESFLKKMLRIENPFYKIIGENSSIKKIYLTGLAPIPEEIKNKVEIVNLKELWNKKTKEEQEEILDIFDFNFEIIDKIKKRRVILFTQPLSEDKVITEAEKINLYKKIIKNYNTNEIILKKHPRENTDYKKYFDIEVLDQSFPSELLNILDIKFEKAVTVFSTAACTLDKNIEIDFYGTEVHPKLLKRFGSMDNIMKRNAFIEEDYNE